MPLDRSTMALDRAQLNKLFWMEDPWEKRIARRNTRAAEAQVWH